MYRISFFALLMPLLSRAPTKDREDPVKKFDLEALVAKNATEALQLTSQDGRTALTYTPDPAGQSLLLSEGGPEWQQSNYLVLEVSHDHAYSGTTNPSSGASTEKITISGLSTFAFNPIRRCCRPPAEPTNGSTRWPLEQWRPSIRWRPGFHRYFSSLPPLP